MKFHAIARTACRFIVAMALACAGTARAQTPDGPEEPQLFLREQVGLSDEQIAMIAHGTPVATLLPSKTPTEIIVFGAIFVKASPEKYVALALDPGRLRRLPDRFIVGRLGNPPTLADLEGFALAPEDIRTLRNCRPGRCEVQLPAEAILALQKEIDWAGPDVTTQVNERVRKMALELLLRYRREGNRALGVYRDKENPFDIDAQLRSLLSRSNVLPGYLRDLNRYLLEYPKAIEPRVQSQFYWERINFGMKPTLRLNHAIAWPSAGPGGPVHVVAVKQLYASHYFQLALDLTMCVTESSQAGSKGFYLISVKDSTQQGLTGLWGSFLRRIVVARTRAAQEKDLIGIKLALEEDN